MSTLHIKCDMETSLRSSGNMEHGNNQNTDKEEAIMDKGGHGDVEVEAIESSFR